MSLTLHVFACWFMTGVIWLVQILIYPLFQKIGQGEFSVVHKFHTERITWIVAPMMTLELVTAIVLCFERHELIFYSNLFSVVLIWILTAFINVPSHNKLSYEAQNTKLNLVNLNWPRTVLWTLRTVFFIFFVIPL